MSHQNLWYWCLIYSMCSLVSMHPIFLCIISMHKNIYILFFVVSSCLWILLLSVKRLWLAHKCRIAIRFTVTYAREKCKSPSQMIYWISYIYCLKTVGLDCVDSHTQSFPEATCCLSKMCWDCLITFATCRLVLCWSNKKKNPGPYPYCSETKTLHRSLHWANQSVSHYARHFFQSNYECHTVCFYMLSIDDYQEQKNFCLIIWYQCRGGFSAQSLARYCNHISLVGKFENLW